MTYSVDVIATKPADVKWYKEAFPEETSKIVDQNRTYPGVINITNISESETTHTITVVFDSKESADAFFASSATDPLKVAREAYHKENNIIQDIRYPE